MGSRGIPAKYGGFETLTQCLAEHLALMGNRVFVAGFSNAAQEQKLMYGNKITLVKVKVTCPARLENIIGTWKAFNSITEITDLDAVLVLNDVNVLVALKSRRRNIRTALHLDGAEEKRSGLPIAGKILHYFFRKIALSSQLDLIVDSDSITKAMNIDSRRVRVIKYAPNLNNLKIPELSNIPYIPDSYFLAVARFVPENQILEIIEAYRSSKREELLLMFGLGTGRKRYETKIVKAASSTHNVKIMPSNYNRSEINWLLRNAKSYIHGHSVGGTNPILVDARFYATRIFCHDNIYNRESSGGKEYFWNSQSQLCDLFKSTEQMVHAENTFDYRFETWRDIATKYAKTLGAE